MDNLKQSYQKIKPELVGLPLKAFNPKDRKWDVKRRDTIKIVCLLRRAGKFSKWADRMDDCARTLIYAMKHAADTGELLLLLRNADLCHCRHCYICNWRRSLMYYARFFEYLPRLVDEYSNSRWVLLTLTVQNCPVDELSETLTTMNKAWQRFVKRKEFSRVQGWIRSTEVTQEKKRPEYAHPHFHAVLMVPPSWFTKYYVKQSRWLEIWRECMRDPDITSVDIRAIQGDVRRGIVEVLKTVNYSIKPETAEKSPEWLLSYFEQVHHKRFLATGGVLKDALKRLDTETTEELIFTKDNPKPDAQEAAREPKLFFDWDARDEVYRERRNND